MCEGSRIVSVSTVLFDGHPMERALEEIARSGAKYVEPAFIRGYMDFSEDDFSESAARGLQQAATDLALSIHAVSAHLDLSSNNAVAMLSRRIIFAEALGARVLITNAGPVVHMGAIRATIEALVKQLEDWGGVLAIENPGHGSDDLVGTAGEGKALIDLIRSPHVRLNHDAGNVFTYSDERLQPADDYASAGSAIGHIHLKDVVSSQSGWNYCPIGFGNVDIEGYINAIPPNLPLSLELPLRLSRPGRADPQRRDQPLRMEDLRAALQTSFAFVTKNRSNLC